MTPMAVQSAAKSSGGHPGTETCNESQKGSLIFPDLFLRRSVGVSRASVQNATASAPWEREWSEAKWAVDAGVTMEPSNFIEKG